MYVEFFAHLATTILFHCIELMLNLNTNTITAIMKGGNFKVYTLILFVWMLKLTGICEIISSVCACLFGHI